MTAKEYLQQGTNIQFRIKSLERSKEICFSRATKSTPSVSDVPPSMNSGTSSKVEDNVLDMVDYDEKIDNLTAQFKEFAFRAVCEINRIPNNISATILTNKYINGMTWEAIATELGYDSDYVQKELHGKALSEFDKNNPENTRKSPVIPT